jgi:hypothetical protein
LGHSTLGVENGPFSRYQPAGLSEDNLYKTNMISDFVDVSRCYNYHSYSQCRSSEVRLAFYLPPSPIGTIGENMILLYLDPGSGSFLIQLLIASLAGAGIAIAINWGGIKRLYKKTKPVDVDKNEDDE